jgi:hypothetical protein
MTANANAATPSDPLNSDPLARAISMVVNAMQTDFASQFRQSYPYAEDIKQLKRRLYSKLREIPEKAVYRGYERCIELKPSFLPSVPEIIAATLGALKDINRDEKNRAEAAMLPPPPTHTPMPPNIRKLWSDIVEKSSKTEEEREVRLPELLAAHNALLANHYTQGKIRHVTPALKLCACCGGLGVLSHSVRGDGNWYCSLHWRPS